MNKTIEEMYSDLVTGISAFDDGPYGSQYVGDEVESFVTSKEIVRNKQILEEKGIKGPDYSRVEETVHFHQYHKRREHKYTESEMRAIEESCNNTIVHDYGTYDIYHLSDEERYKNDMLAEMDMKIARLRRSYSKVDQYIEAMRIVVEAWEILSKKNFLHTSDEFFKMVGEGRITSGRIIMPKLKKAERYNMDLIVKYISNPELDPTDLLPARDDKKDEDEDYYDSFYFDINEVKNEEFKKYFWEYVDNYKEQYGYEEDDEDFDLESIQSDAIEYARNTMAAEKTARLISPEEAEVILENMNNPGTANIKGVRPAFIKGYDRRGNTISKKKFNKKERYIIRNLHDMLIKIQNNPEFNDPEVTRTYLISNGMFDATKIPKSIWDDLIYRGSWSDENAAFLFDLVVQEELLKQSPPKEDYLTYADKQLALFFKTLDDSGLSATAIELRRRMNQTDEDIKKRVSKRTKKENKKIESDLLQRITKLNDNEKFKKIVTKAEKELFQDYQQY